MSSILELGQYYKHFLEISDYQDSDASVKINTFSIEFTFRSVNGKVDYELNGKSQACSWVWKWS